MRYSTFARVTVAGRAQTAASSDVDFSQQAVREIAEVKGGTPPAKWLQAHAGEKLQISDGPRCIQVS